MKLTRPIGIAAFLFAVIFAFTSIAAAQSSSIPNVAPPIVTLNSPSPYLADWQSRASTATVAVINGGAAFPSHVWVEFFLNGSRVAYSQPAKLPVTTIGAGSNLFNGETLVPLSAVKFENTVDQSSQRAGRIPDGQVCIIVHIQELDSKTLMPTGREAKGEGCSLVLSYTPPTLILPADQSELCKLGSNNVIDKRNGQPVPLFQWSPIVPAPADPTLGGIVKYHFAIYEVLPGQSPIAAFRSARAVFETGNSFLPDLINQTNLLWPTQYFLPEKGKQYVWSVRALDNFGNPFILTNDGWATPFTFSIPSNCDQGASSGLQGLVISTESIDFGSINLGNISPSQQIILTNTGANFINLHNPVISNADALHGFIITDAPPLLTLAPGTNTTFTVAFKPTQIGSADGSVKVITEGGTVTVVLKGQGMDTKAPTISIQSPQGGEQLAPGSQFNIKFSASDNDALSNFIITYSTDGGINFFPITHLDRILTSPMELPWNIPSDISTDQARIKIQAQDKNGNTPYAVSNQFSIRTPRGMDAQLVSENFPACMQPGSNMQVSVTMKNTGAETWDPLSISFFSQSTPQNLWGPISVKLTDPVPSGSNYTFTFRVTAPIDPGNYFHAWSMQRIDASGNIGLFGPPIAKPVTVAPGCQGTGGSNLNQGDNWQFIPYGMELLKPDGSPASLSSFTGGQDKSQINAIGGDSAIGDLAHTPLFAVQYRESDFEFITTGKTMLTATGGQSVPVLFPAEMDFLPAVQSLETPAQSVPGGLVTGSIVPIGGGGKTVEVLFNPKEYSVNKSVQWEPHKSPGLDLPEMQFTSGDPSVLSVELFFDSYEDKGGVKQKVSKFIGDLTGDGMPDVVVALNKINSNPQQTYLFNIGDHHLPVKISNISQKYTMFLPDGTPTRATVSMRLMEQEGISGQASALLDQMRNQEILVAYEEGDPDRPIVIQNDPLLTDPTFVPSEKALRTVIRGMDRSHRLSPELMKAKEKASRTKSMSNKTEGDFNQAHKFTVEIDGVAIGGINTIEGLEHEHEVLEYHDGDDMTTRYRPGRQKPGTITITRDWSNTKEWYNWRKDVMDGKVERKSISVIFHNDAGEESGRYNFYHCWPTKYTGPSLDAKNSGHATESIELSYENISADPEISVYSGNIKTLSGETGGNGTPGNGTPDNGTPSNGVPTNGVPTNGVPMNGVPTNGVPTNGVPTNGAKQTTIVMPITFNGTKANAVLIGLLLPPQNVKVNASEAKMAFTGNADGWKWQSIVLDGTRSHDADRNTEAGSSDKRSYTAGNFALELDGKPAGKPDAIVVADLDQDGLADKMGADHVQKKHLAGVKYEDITVRCGTGMSKDFYQWIENSLNGRHKRQDGAIVAADYNYKEFSRLNFYHALITEVGLPALDAASKDAAKMTIKFKPETTRLIQGDTVKPQDRNPKEQKQWMPSNFRLKIDGLDEACKKVTKIEALTLRQKNVEHAVGQMRDYEQEPAKLEYPHLIITLPDTSGISYNKWRESDFLKKHFNPEKVKDGSLDYLADDGSTIITVTFHNLGIFKVTPDKMEAGNENIRRVKVELYCEEMKFEYKADSWN